MAMAPTAWPNERTDSPEHVDLSDIVPAGRQGRRREASRKLGAHRRCVLAGRSGGSGANTSLS
eukprot:CAMPEP_0170291848 /NCGR_PEP_ID=MMETSP0116_2-20130129/46018_1 /TAXON_ID=400756 /ORGANISM="Durinskia baltica, Strain CSIRO CS-38" /LENGTH=62 /DNA_ID=CAMNT_0010543339 /DNA_START=397 /DNA_END=582 /DNA_ORIENTATION=-